MISSQCSRFYRAVFASSGAVLGLLPLLIAGEARAGWLFKPVANTLSAPFTPRTQYTSIDNGLGTAGGLNWTFDTVSGQWVPIYNLSDDPMYQAGKGVVAKDGKVAYVAEKTANGQSYQVISLGIPSTDPEPLNETTTYRPTYVVDTRTRIGDWQAGGWSFGQGIALRSLPETQAKEVAFVATNNATGESKIFAVSSASGSVAREIASSNQYGQFAPGLTINKNGEVAFTAKKDGITDVYKAPQEGGAPVSLTKCINPNPICPIKFEAPSINDAGKVSFSSQNGVFVDYQGTITPIVSNDTSFVSGSYREANINNSGLVSAFLGMTPNWDGGIDGYFGQVIFTGG
jgi:hypothetical protein